MEKSYRAELVGAFGCPIDENPTGVVEEAAFAAKGLNYRYLTVKVNDGDLEAAMNGVRAFNMRGINLTIPHKVKVLQYLDELSEAAELIGAVNMVVNNDGKLWGENTDGKGYLKSLTEAGVSLKGKTSQSSARAAQPEPSAWNAPWPEQPTSPWPTLSGSKARSWWTCSTGKPTPRPTSFSGIIP